MVRGPRLRSARADARKFSARCRSRRIPHTQTSPSCHPRNSFAARFVGRAGRAFSYLRAAIDIGSAIMPAVAMVPANGMAAHQVGNDGCRPCRASGIAAGATAWFWRRLAAVRRAAQPRAALARPFANQHHRDLCRRRGARRDRIRGAVLAVRPNRGCPVSGRNLDFVDALIGRNIRLYRAMKNVSQAALAGAIGVTAQQVQKYESGRSRVSASGLFRVATALGVPVNRFFIEPALFAEGATSSTLLGSRR